MNKKIPDNRPLVNGITLQQFLNFWHTIDHKHSQRVPPFVVGDMVSYMPEAAAFYLRDAPICGKRVVTISQEILLLQVCGEERIVSLRGIVGMHQHYYDQPRLIPVVFAVEGIQKGQGETMQHLIDLGVDPSLMLFSLNTPPEEIYALIEEELVDTRIATQIID
ncbi:hypothetical protein [Ruegeria sp. HKCCE4150]|uniref:hypothetical protein n=1 Tax=Ruegeria sp. HKCCE4150 TaxID=2794828 RepID=UPI001AE529AB|nr:hypothetical protein [Ruegeria sp. HKCCE4150]